MGIADQCVDAREHRTSESTNAAFVLRRVSFGRHCHSCRRFRRWTWENDRNGRKSSSRRTFIPTIAGQVEVEQVSALEAPRVAAPMKRSLRYFPPSALLSRKPTPARRHLELPVELRIAVVRTGHDEKAFQRFRGRVGDVLGRPAHLLEAERTALVSISLNWAMRASGPMICTQPPFIPGSIR